MCLFFVVSGAGNIKYAVVFVVRRGGITVNRVVIPFSLGDGKILAVGRCGPIATRIVSTLGTIINSGCIGASTSILSICGSSRDLTPSF